MRAVVCIASLSAVVTVAAEQRHDPAMLASVLERAGERMQRYFARAQSLVCLELVRLQPLTPSWSSDGFGRTVESELRLSWTPADDGQLSTDAEALRQVLRVNGHKPRPDDHTNCTTPEQETREPQLVSLLLPAKRADYEFTPAGHGRVDRRPAIMVNYRLLKKVTVASRLVEGREDCVSFNVEGGTRGRLWIDRETHDVLRLDQSLSGMVEIPLPPLAARRSHGRAKWTMERWDTSIRYQAVSFTNPDETLVLPVTMSSLSITRGAGTPRLRTTTDYVNCQRFLTAGRIVTQN